MWIEVNCFDGGPDLPRESSARTANLDRPRKTLTIAGGRLYFDHCSIIRGAVV